MDRNPPLYTSYQSLKMIIPVPDIKCHRHGSKKNHAIPWPPHVFTSDGFAVMGDIHVFRPVISFLLTFTIPDPFPDCKSIPAVPPEPGSEESEI